MAECDPNLQIETPPTYPDPTGDIEIYVSDCDTYNTWFSGKVVPVMNKMYVCVNGWYTGVGTMHSEVETWKNNTFSYMETTKGYRDEVINASSQLPAGTLVNAFVKDQISGEHGYTQLEIITETQTQGISSMEETDGNTTKIIYENSDYISFSYDSNGNMTQLIYTDADGTVRVGNTTTYNYDSNNNFLNSTRS